MILLAYNLNRAGHLKTSDAPLEIPFQEVNSRAFFMVHLDGKEVPMRFALDRANSRIDPYLSGLKRNGTATITLGTQSGDVQIAPALGPMGYYTLNKHPVIGYLGQDFFRGKVVLFEGSNKITVFTPAEWLSFRDQTQLPLKGSIAIPMAKLANGYLAIPIKSESGSDFMGELDLGAEGIGVSGDSVNKLFLGLSLAEAESTPEKSVVGGLKVGPQLICPYGVEISDGPVDPEQSGVTISICEQTIAGRAFAVDFSSNELVLQKQSPSQVLAYMLEGQSLVSCHESNGQIFVGDDSTQVPNNQPYISPVSKIEKFPTSSLVKWVQGKTREDVQLFEKAFDSILAVQKKYGKIHITFATPSGEVTLPTG